MKNLFVSLVLISVFFLFNCKENKDETISTINDVTLKEGFKVLNTSCFSCHNPNPNNKIKVAPSVKELKLAYINEFKDFESFTKHFIAFQQNPTKHNSIMPEAVEKYGIMPKLEYTKEQLKAVASYLYTSNIEADEWFTSSLPSEKEKYLKETNEQNPVETGKDIAMKTKSVLGKNLLNAIKTKGTEGAVSFCSTRAITLTDSIGSELNASVKRVSDLNRNPKNKANARELEYIAKNKLLLLDGKEMEPQLIETEKTIVCYYPITTNAMCLQCHGKVGTNITQQTYSKIKSLYPDDKAIGYGENELRGIWVVEMEK